jgi:hypothetical protein
MRDLPLLGRSLYEPVCWNLFHSREMVLWCSIDLARCQMCTVALKNERPMYRRENSLTFYTGTLRLIQLLN